MQTLFPATVSRHAANRSQLDTNSVSLTTERKISVTDIVLTENPCVTIEVHPLRAFRSHTKAEYVQQLEGHSGDKIVISHHAMPRNHVTGLFMDRKGQLVHMRQIVAPAMSAGLYDFDLAIVKNQLDRPEIIRNFKGV
ncbi:hypothetical protein O166_00195 [Pseudogulbenkiania ferrooxidans EGD-HP2]|uniref:Uncharacterized protein n=1 Tax=Pseudogulbenkiania ferrooxidans EGD-HP2 TaxID=1388764 RepID=A0ABN0N9F0_9NEIS|nr:hypothetical protein O166_00195 [Pseudogulbenkiania ferrooxidans EGD-HP2]